ncbi:MAG: thioredoxin [bacterium]
MAVIQVAQDKFKEEVLDNKGVVFVDFYAQWCGPCKVTSPVIDEISEEKKDIKFVKIDVDQNSDLASQYSIFSIPTFIVFKDGKVINQLVGAMGKEAFLEEIKKSQ